MNESLEYLLKKKEELSDKRNWLTLSDFTNNTILDFFETYVGYVAILPDKSKPINDICVKKRYVINNAPLDIEISVKRNENNEFYSYLSAGSYNNGSWIFTKDLIVDIVQRCLVAGSFVGSGFTQEEFLKKIKSGKYNVLYEVGDIIITQTTVKRPYTNTHFECNLSSVFLPIKKSLIERNGN